MYVELVEREITNRGKIVTLAEVGTQAADFERYISLFPFTQKIHEHIKLHHSVSGYDGAYFCPVLMVDVDSKDLKEAHRQALKVIEHWKDTYSLDPDDLYIYFSGAKGFHLGIPQRVVGGVPYREDLPEKVKQFIAKIIPDQHCIDLQIYNGQRIFRVANSLNKKSGMYKIQLTYEEMQMGIDWIFDNSDAARPGFVRSKLVSEIRENEKLKNLFQSILQGYTGTFQLPKDGQRNNSLFKQACTLFAKRMNRSDVQDIISGLNAASQSPLEKSELSTLLKSAEKYEIKETEPEVRTFGECIEIWYQSIKPENNKLSLVFQAFNQEFKGKLRGKLGIILGKGGSKKSLYAQNICYHNIFHTGSRALYSTMEMPISELISRFIDMVIDDAGTNGSRWLERQEHTSPGFARSFVEKNIMPMFADKILISDNTAMTAEGYDFMIRTAYEKYGQIDILVPDGLSMMRHGEREIEAVNKHTAELKGLAIKWNIFIPLIVHVTKDTDYTTKDLIPFARGSEKIMDNCDFAVSMSLIEENNMGLDEKVFRKDLGHIRAWNKRGSGNIVEFDYKFNAHKLLMYEQDF